MPVRRLVSVQSTRKLLSATPPPRNGTPQEVLRGKLAKEKWGKFFIGHAFWLGVSARKSQASASQPSHADEGQGAGSKSHGRAESPSRTPPCDLAVAEPATMIAAA